MPKLETVTVTGVEVLGVGTWNGDPYDAEDLDAMVAAFDGGNAGIEPPVKLGHTDKQQIIQNDGLPAAGYVARLYRKGEKLIADLRDVPKRIADLINAKAYSKVSSEVWFNLKPPSGGKRLSRVLSGIALLGADVPAVTSLSDIEALYGAKREEVERAGYYAIPSLPVIDRRAMYDYYEDLPATTIGACLEAIIHTSFTNKADDLRKWSQVTTDERIALSNAIGDALKAFTSSSVAEILARPIEGRLAAYSTDDGHQRDKAPAKQLSEEDGMKDVLKKLGLADDADEAAVLSKIAELEQAKTDAEKAAAESPRQGEYVSKADYSTLQNQVGTLTAQLAKTSAETAVEDAIRSGKVIPAQREWANTYALADADGFRAYVESAPAFPLGQLGTDDKAEDVELTSAERSVASMLGVDEAKLKETKQAMVAQPR